MILGSDPEYPLVDANGKHIMAIGMVGGTKKNPLPLSMGMVQEDNVMAEINTPPADSEDAFVEAVLSTYHALEAHLAPKGLSPIIQSAVHFTKEELMAGGKQAMEFGCTPDFSPYGGSTNKVPNSRTTLRTAGGHIHVNHKTALDKPQKTAIAMDLFLGVPSILMDKAGSERRIMYGRAGAYRPKSYGIEYRVLSNFWTANEELIRWVWRNTKRALEFVEGDNFTRANKNLLRNISYAINDNTRYNIDNCKQYIKRFDLEVL